MSNCSCRRVTRYRDILLGFDGSSSSPLAKYLVDIFKFRPRVLTRLSTIVQLTDSRVSYGTSTWHPPTYRIRETVSLNGTRSWQNRETSEVVTWTAYLPATNHQRYEYYKSESDIYLLLHLVLVTRSRIIDGTVT